MNSISSEPFQNLDKRQARSRIQTPRRRSNGTATAQNKAAGVTTDKTLATEGAKTTATNHATKVAQIAMVATALATATNLVTIAPVTIDGRSKQLSSLFGNLKSDPSNDLL